MNDNYIFTPYTYRETRNGIESVTMPSELFKDRKLFLIGDVDSVSMGVLLQSLMCLDKISNEPIEMYINSPGGDVNSGLAVYRYITEQMRSPVHTYCIGRAASMGAIIYLAGDKRFMYAGTEIMIHDPASISGTYENPEQLRDRLAKIESIKEMLCEIIADRTNIKAEDIAEITKKDTYYTAEEAVKYGLATQIIIRKDAV